jgi:hypothetical protein
MTYRQRGVVIYLPPRSGPNAAILCDKSPMSPPIRQAASLSAVLPGGYPLRAIPRKM